MATESDAKLFHSLTKLEVKLLRLKYDKALQAREIALQLQISEGNYYIIQRNIFKKLQIVTTNIKKDGSDELIRRYGELLNKLTSKDIENWQEEKITSQEHPDNASTDGGSLTNTDKVAKGNSRAMWMGISFLGILILMSVGVFTVLALREAYYFGTQKAGALGRVETATIAPTANQITHAPSAVPLVPIPSNTPYPTNTSQPALTLIPSKTDTPIPTPTLVPTPAYYEEGENWIYKDGMLISLLSRFVSESSVYYCASVSNGTGLGFHILNQTDTNFRVVFEPDKVRYVDDLGNTYKPLCTASGLNPIQGQYFDEIIGNYDNLDNNLYVVLSHVNPKAKYLYITFESISGVGPIVFRKDLY